MFGDEAILVHDVEPAASFLLGKAVSLVHSIPECQDDDDNQDDVLQLPDGQDDAATSAARPRNHDPLMFERLRGEALHLHSPIQASQHCSGCALDIIIEHQILLLVPDVSLL